MTCKIVFESLFPSVDNQIAEAISKEIEHSMRYNALCTLSKLPLKGFWEFDTGTYRKSIRKVKEVKSLYKVYIVVSESKVHEVNIVAKSKESAKFEAVKKVAPDIKYDDLDVYAIRIFGLKDDCC